MYRNSQMVIKNNQGRKKNEMIKNTKRLLMGLGLGLLLVASAAVFANNSSAFSNARPQVVIALSGTVERNNESLALDKIDSVKPGEILNWTIASENKGDGDAKEYKAVGKIPAGTVLVADSIKVQGEATATYSIDGGKSFSEQPMIEEKQTDGSLKMVSAPISMYSQIRFEWSSPLNAKEKLNASYDVRVK
jgi:uncharacterized repeat protein (TIGR01451 family)